jgi:2-keto-4-pentenoate hydratase/2-oxohepta-3-ene-1,7-dioic acid hydratase in catechol pathway
MIFDIPTLIETISRGITLFPGDIIATGTPAGVGMGLKPPRYLKAGDVVRVEIEGIGYIENKFV